MLFFEMWFVKHISGRITPQIHSAMKTTVYNFPCLNMLNSSLIFPSLFFNAGNKRYYFPSTLNSHWIQVVKDEQNRLSEKDIDKIRNQSDWWHFKVRRKNSRSEHLLHDLIYKTVKTVVNTEWNITELSKIWETSNSCLHLTNLQV